MFGNELVKTFQIIHGLLGESYLHFGAPLRMAEEEAVPYVHPRRHCLQRWSAQLQCSLWPEAFFAPNLMLLAPMHVIGHEAAQELAAVLSMALGGFLELLPGQGGNTRTYGFLNDESPM